jgi:hypothetical protein
MTRYIIERRELRLKEVMVVMNEEEERAGGRHTLSIGLRLSQ